MRAKKDFRPGRLETRSDRRRGPQDQLLSVQRLGVRGQVCTSPFSAIWVRRDDARHPEQRHPADESCPGLLDENQDWPCRPSNLLGALRRAAVGSARRVDGNDRQYSALRPRRDF